MENYTPFSVKNGNIESDCMESTHRFISDNVKYLIDAIKPIRAEVTKSSKFSFVFYEDNWSFATKIDNMELGAITDGVGGILESRVCEYDAIFEELEKQ